MNSIGLERPLLNGKVNFPFMLAPMVGLSHVALRLLIRTYLPKNAITLWPTEMLNSRRLPSETLGQKPETIIAPFETEVVPQILGNEEREIALSVQKLESWGVSAIDINMGCPVKKALKHNYGVALMGDMKYAASVVDMTVRNTSLPVSVKLRAGHQKDLNYLIDFAGALKEAGASWLCLHPRLAAERRKGNADWEQIRLLREAIDLPIIGNGDVQIAGDAIDMLNQTSCDAVMIGRALTIRPWMLWELGEKLGWEAPEGRDHSELPKNLSEEAQEYGRSLLQLLKYFMEYFPESLGLRKFAFHLKVSHPWLDFGHSLVSGCSNKKSYDELYEFIEYFFAKSTFYLSERTALRY